jgi:hypothetical protein
MEEDLSPSIVMDNSGQTVGSSPIAITGTVTTESGRTVEVTSPGLTVVCDDDDWGTGTCTDTVETFTVASATLSEGLNTKTFTATDSESDTDVEDFLVFLDTTPPEFVSATINGTAVVIDWSEPCTQGTGYTDSDFDLDMSVTGSDIGVTFDAGDGTDQWTMTAASTAVNGEDVDIYFNGAADSVEDDAGNDLAEFIPDKTVTNNTGVVAGCDSENPFLCLTQSPCEGAGFDWWGDACRTEPEPNWTGPDTVTNGKLESWSGGVPDDWDDMGSGANITEVDGGAQLVGYGGMRQVVFEFGKSYIVALNLVDVTAGQLEVYYDDVPAFFSTGNETVIVELEYLGGDNRIYLQAPSGSNDVTINDIVIRELAETTPNISPGITLSQGIEVR